MNSSCPHSASIMYTCMQRERVLCVFKYICIDGGYCVGEHLYICYIKLDIHIYLYNEEVLCVCVNSALSLGEYLCIYAEREKGGCMVHSPLHI